MLNLIFTHSVVRYNIYNHDNANIFMDLFVVMKYFSFRTANKNTV